MSQERSYRTRYADAVLIVSSKQPWVAVKSAYWQDNLAEDGWNEAYSLTADTIPVDAIRMGLLDDVYRKGYVCRPILPYVDFNNAGIRIEKGVS